MKDIDFKHKEYEKRLPAWTKCRRVAEGSEAVKAEGTAFLPPLSDQSDEDYSNYKERALFFEGTGRTIEGLLGMLFAKEPTIQEPGDFSDRATPGFETTKDFLKGIAKDVITVGRAGLLVDMTEEGKVYLVNYCAENIINWRVELEEGRHVLKFVVLREEMAMYDGYKRKTRKSYRVLEVIDGIYTQSVYVHVDNDDQSDEFERISGSKPVKGGKSLTSIPFYFINASGAKTAPERPPLTGLVNANIAHYMNSADLEHGRHFTGLPTAWAAGFGMEEDGELSIGSQTAWISSKSDASCGYLEFTGQGLGSLERGLVEKENAMVILGARFLAAPKKVQESGISESLKRQGENSILSNIADSVSDSVTSALQFAADWGNEPKAKYLVEINKEFTSLRADPQLLTAMIAAVQGGLMTQETWFYNLKGLGMVQDGVTLEEEKALLEAQNSARFIVEKEEKEEKPKEANESS